MKSFTLYKDVPVDERRSYFVGIGKFLLFLLALAVAGVLVCIPVTILILASH